MISNVSIFQSFCSLDYSVLVVIVIYYAASAKRAQKMKKMRSGYARHCLNREQQKVLTQKSQSLNIMHPGASLFAW